MKNGKSPADEGSASQELVARRLCPFIQDPDPDCYCLSQSSQNIEATIFYCSGYFKRCEIYKRRVTVKHGKE
jgi:hypothetical protein